MPPSAVTRVSGKEELLRTEQNLLSLQCKTCHRQRKSLLNPNTRTTPRREAVFNFVASAVNYFNQTLAALTPLRKKFLITLSNHERQTMLLGMGDR